VAAILILILMTVCSMKFVRKSGLFWVFHVTHLNYFAYYILLLIHAPQFWKWIVFFGTIWMVEFIYRTACSFLDRGKSFIVEGLPLASRVTSLKIKKPPKFHYSPGDWVFIKVPAIAKYEWHPFTISSAPENEEIFTVHVRSVGEWTNKLYNHFLQDAALNNNPIYMERNLYKQLEVYVDGPFGSPSSNIYRSEHAVLIGTGIGITPFASILQSITHRYRQVKKRCPSCKHTWCEGLESSMGSLKKVDFFWINRDQKCFECS